MAMNLGMVLRKMEARSAARHKGFKRQGKKKKRGAGGDFVINNPAGLFQRPLL